MLFRFLYKITLLLPILLLVIGVNYFVDPANLYHDKSFSETGERYEEIVATYLASGYNVANIETLDERLLHKSLIRKLKLPPPQLIVLGSSRSQLIGNNLYPEKRVINNSVTGATMEDLLALYALYDSMNFKPNEVIIELSPWYLNDNNGQLRWKSLAYEYENFKNKLSSDSSHAEIALTQSGFSLNPKLLELFSFEYFQQSIKSLSANKMDDNDWLFSRSEFKNDYSLKGFYEQFSVLLAPGTKTQIPDDTIKSVNDYLRKHDLYNILKKVYPDQEFPQEIISLHAEITSEAEGEWRDFAEVQKRNLCKLNRKLIEIVFYQTCPPSESSLTYPTQKRDNNGLTRVVDGTISYPESFRNQTVDEVNFGVQSFLNASIFGLADFREISQRKLDLLRSMLNYLKSQDINVKLILVPYHPTVYDVIISKNIYKNVLEAERIYKDLAIKEGLEIAGSYNPEICGLAQIDFYDAMHPKELAFKRILNQKFQP